MKYLEILRSALVRKKKKSPSYSNNALARDLKISGSFLSSILCGKKDIPHKLLPKLFLKLELDDLSKNEFLKKMLIHKYTGSIFETYLNSVSKINDYNFLPLLSQETSILDKWYYLALLEKISCKNFEENLETLANEFSITVGEVLESFLVLESEEVVGRNEGGKLYKSERFLRVPTLKTSEKIRGFHSQMIDQAKLNLNNKVSDDDFKARLTSGITLAVNPEKLDQCKALLEEAIHNIGIQLSEGDCTEVYQMNIQLFPLSR